MKDAHACEERDQADQRADDDVDHCGLRCVPPPRMTSMSVLVRVS